MVSRYQKRISGPLLDRIDIHIPVITHIWPDPRGFRRMTSQRRMSHDSGVRETHWKDRKTSGS
jgi:predicted ATPase with chaperone activity